MRVALVLLAFAAALGGALPAAAELEPVRRPADVPRVRTGTIPAPSSPAGRRVEVVVELPQPPLARYYGRTLQTRAGSQRLNLRGAASRTYLRRLTSAQTAAVEQLRRTIPDARVGSRLRIVLNAIAVELPASRLPALLRLPFAARVSPSRTYAPFLNTSPAIIGASPSFAGGSGGAGIKIGIVDDGIDRGNAFFTPGGFEYPAGFPKGNRNFTTPKVIVARAFPARRSGTRDRLPFDANVSFHGTHVAGIAAGNAGTSAPAGDDHPPVAGLSGVAPRAWVGSYRVFTVPTPIGHVGNTPQIAAAFEAAVADGMDVINFSGGGTETDPSRDALLRAVEGVAAAGVVPVIAAGNDREDFGLGSAGSPGTAASAITVAAASNSQVFSSALEVLAADAAAPLKSIPLRQADSLTRGGFDKPIVDVGTITGTDGRPVDRLLCGPPGQVNEGRGTLPAGSVVGAVALASRGVCTFASKAERARAAGAVGLVLVDNRPGEANGIPIQLAVPAGMIADVDGARLREFLGGHGGRTTVRIHDGPIRVDTGRGGVITSFSSGGPTAFEHRLKPDLAAPGGQILSATTRFSGGPFAVFDGTSMAAPHVAGAAALLRQRHPSWTAQQVKSALMGTAGPAWADTARTAEAPVLLEGAGLADVARADDPLLFTAPASLSFPDLDVTQGARTGSIQVALNDAGGGAGAWEVVFQPQAATAGAHVDLPGLVQVAPGGETSLAVVARADAGAAAGENYGFVVLRRGAVVRRIPYFFLVTRPAFANVTASALRRTQRGDTRSGTSRVNVYRYPAAPFGPAPNYFGAPMDELGGERLFQRRIGARVVNFGVVAIPRNAQALPHPWLLGSRDENDVEGAAATPVNANNLTIDFQADVGAAGAVFPRAGTYFVVVDSGRDPFSGASLAGPYTLRSWINDLRAPRVVPLTTRVAAGRPTIAFRAVDRPTRGSGIDPLSLVIGYRNVLVGAAAYDESSGIVLVPLPAEAPQLGRGRPQVTFMASDFQETKNVATPGDSILPNSTTRRARVRVVGGAAVTWLLPRPGACARRTTRLVALASSTARIRSVRFFDGERRVALDRRGDVGLFAGSWNVRRVKRGPHVLRAVAVDARGRRAETTARIRVCR